MKGRLPTKSLILLRRGSKVAKRNKKAGVDQQKVDEFHYFATPIYITRQPRFLDIVKSVAVDSLEKSNQNKEPDKIHPMRMSGNMLEDERIAEFANFVGSTAWNILSSQGFAMDEFTTTFTEMWCQEHHQTSSMEHHLHPGCFLVGFYFIDVPDGAPSAVIYDPRPSRIMMNLPETDVSQATLASTMINFKPEPGMMLFAPSWVAHSFGRNSSEEPFRFVHFNLTVQQNIPMISISEAEVV